MRSSLLKGECSLCARNIATLNILKKTHMRPLAHMCFCNADFARKIISQHTESDGYWGWVAHMVLLDKYLRVIERIKYVKNEKKCQIGMRHQSGDYFVFIQKDGLQSVLPWKKEGEGGDSGGNLRTSDRNLSQIYAKSFFIFRTSTIGRMKNSNSNHKEKAIKKYKLNGVTCAIRQIRGNELYVIENLSEQVRWKRFHRFSGLVSQKKKKEQAEIYSAENSLIFNRLSNSEKINDSAFRVVKRDVLRSQLPLEKMEKETATVLENKRASMKNIFNNFPMKNVCIDGKEMTWRQEKYELTKLHGIKWHIDRSRRAGGMSSTQNENLCVSEQMTDSEWVYCKKNIILEQMISRLKKDIYEMVKKIQDDWWKGEQHIGIDREGVTEKLSEQVTRQEERFRELEKMCKELAGKTVQWKTSSVQPGKYAEILDNSMKLEGMRYGLPY